MATPCRIVGGPLRSLGCGLAGVEFGEELLELAERDCFVGSSLTAKPSYRWLVNGRIVA